MLGQAELGPWPSLLLQGGAFVLLSYIVIVMAPKQAADQRAERETRDKLHKAEVETLETKFDERHVNAVKVITELNAAALKEMQKSTEALAEAARSLKTIAEK
jgi:hypothetical protein